MWLWSQGDYPRLATMLEPAAQSLAQRCVLPQMKVLDVAAGTGNFAAEAARLGAIVTATDVTPRMVELGAARTAADGLEVEWRTADAEFLPFGNGAFDLVASVFGAMFAPRPELVASDLFRTQRPGGIVAMANYGAQGYLGRLGELIARFSIRTDVTFPSPFEWGDEAVVRARMQPYAAGIEVERRTLRFTFASFEEWQSTFANTNPPLMALKAILPAAAFEGLIRDAWAVAEELNVATTGVAVESAYLEVLATSPRG